MKKTNRKRLELEGEVVALLAALPAANLKHVQGGTIEVTTEFLTYSCIGKCSTSCIADGCPSHDLC